MEKSRLRIGVAGSTAQTVTCARALHDDPRFEIVLILTPEPKPLGRKQVVTPNPLHAWATAEQIPVVLVGRRIDDHCKAAILASESALDVLLVVDFGYLVPNWLLELPSVAPLNIHPSRLPRWRGSSPGQFALLYGDSESAVTLMRMTAGLDEGPIIAQPQFLVDPNWTQREYYEHAFSLVSAQLADAIAAYVASARSGAAMEQPQPAASQTVLARRLTKDDGFVAWGLVKQLMSNDSVASEESRTKGDGANDGSIGDKDLTTNKTVGLSPLLHEALGGSQATKKTLVTLVARAARALSPWPGLWTRIPTAKGEKRLKILSCSVVHDRLQLDSVQIEGQQVARFEEVKNVIISPVIRGNHT